MTRVTNGILEGVRVVAFEQQVSGPYCTMMLADQGAEVIKVERPGSGDTGREMAPKLRGQSDEAVSGYFLRFNRNKKSITLDVRSDAGKQVYKDLVARADVVVENFRPGTVERLGLGYDDLSKLNPRLVYTAISGFGRDSRCQGPFSDRPAYDIVVQAMAGLMHMCGQDEGPPTWLGVAVGDIVTGMLAAYATILALYKREKAGEGDFVDVSMYDCMIALAERGVHVYSFTGNVVTRGRERLIAPWGPYRCCDGWVALIIPTEDMWRRFCSVLGMDQLSTHPDLSSGPGRASNRHLWEPAVQEWMMSRSKEHVCQSLLAAGVPVGPVQDPSEVFSCPHVKARGMVVGVPDSELGSVSLVGNPLKFGRMPMPGFRSAPRLGEHTEVVLREVLGYPPERISELKAKGVI